MFRIRRSYRNLRNRIQGGLKRWPHFGSGHSRSGVKGKVSATALGVDDKEEFSAGGESGSQAESWMGERIST